MDIKQQIKGLIQEAELYRSQGLIQEAKGKYVAIVSLIEANARIKNRQSLIDGISKKITSLENEIDRLASAPTSVEVPEKIQDLIKRQFAFAADKDEDSAAIEGAIALAKFGQFERALKEFNLLLDKESVRVDAAKNIIRCYMTHTSIEDAVREYEKWFSSEIFTTVQLNSVCSFLEDILEKKGIDKTLPRPKEAEPVEVKGFAVAEDLDEDEFLDISAIKIKMEDGPQKGKTFEFDVNFQSGNVLSLIISKGKISGRQFKCRFKVE